MHTQKPPKIYYMEIITTGEVIDKLDMFQDIFGKVDEFGWCYLGRISADTGTQFTSTDFWDELQTCSVWLTFAAPEYQEMNKKVYVTWRMFCMIEHSLMVHVQVL